MQTSEASADAPAGVTRGATHLAKRSSATGEPGCFEVSFASCAEAAEGATRALQLASENGAPAPDVAINLAEDGSWALRVSGVGVDERLRGAVASKGKPRRAKRASLATIGEVRQQLAQTVRAAEASAQRSGRRASLPAGDSAGVVAAAVAAAQVAAEARRERPRPERRRSSLPHALQCETLDDVRRRAELTLASALAAPEHEHERESKDEIEHLPPQIRRHRALAERVWVAWAESTEELASGLLAAPPQQPHAADHAWHSGWLLKQQSGGGGGWATRWFELRGSRLFYYGARDDDTPRGYLHLDNVEVAEVGAPARRRGGGRRARRFTWAGRPESGPATPPAGAPAQPAAEPRRERRPSLAVSSPSPRSERRRRFTWSRGRSSPQLATTSPDSPPPPPAAPQAAATDGHTIELRASNDGRIVVTKLTKAGGDSPSCASPRRCTGEQPADYVVTRTTERRVYRLKVATAPDAADWARALRLAAAHSHLELPTKAAPAAGHRRSSSSADAPLGKDLASAVPFAARLGIRQRMGAVRSVRAFKDVLREWLPSLTEMQLPRAAVPTVDQVVKDLVRETVEVVGDEPGGGRFAGTDAALIASLDERVGAFARSERAAHAMVGTVLIASARTTSGGDAYLLVNSLFGGGSALITAAQDSPLPIRVAVDAERSCATVRSSIDFDVYFDEDFEAGPVRVRCVQEERLEFGSGFPERVLSVSCPSVGGSVDGGAGGGGSRMPGCLRVDR